MKILLQSGSQLWGRGILSLKDVSDNYWNILGCYDHGGRIYSWHLVAKAKDAVIGLPCGTGQPHKQELFGPKCQQ